MTPIAWFSQPWAETASQLPFEHETVPPNADGSPTTRLQVLAALVGLNNGPTVHGYGVIRYGGGPYGRIGLSQQEAFALMELSAILMGMCIALDVDASMPLTQAFEAEWKRVSSIRAGKAAP